MKQNTFNICILPLSNIKDRKAKNVRERGRKGKEITCFGNNGKMRERVRVFFFFLVWMIQVSIYLSKF